MARPKKAGLDFYYRDVDEMDEYHRMLLMDRYGPTGCVVLDLVISRIYKNGYYLEVPLDALSAQIFRVIGSKWVESMGKITEIIRYCGEIGLFDPELLARSVLTSEEIQRNYSYVSARRKADRSKYWLLSEPDGGQTDNSPQKTSHSRETEVIAAKNDVFASETGINAAIIPQSREEAEAEKTRVNEMRADAEQTQSRREEMQRGNGTFCGTETAAAAALPAAAGYGEIDRVFFGTVGRHLGETDMEDIDVLRGEGAEDSLITSVIGKVASRGGTKRPNRINSFRYFMPIIREKLSGRSCPPSAPPNEYAYVSDGFIHNASEDYDPYAGCTTTEEYLAVLDSEYSYRPMGS